MKKMPLRLAALLLLLGTAVHAQNCHLVQRIDVMDGRSDTTFYEWDKTGKQVTRILLPNEEGGHRAEEYSYGEKAIHMKQDGVFASSYFSDDAGRLAGFMIYDDLGVSNHYATYDYDKGGKLIKKTMFHTPFMADTTVLEYTIYQYKGDQMVQEDYYTDFPTEGAAPTFGLQYEYDKIPNPGHWAMTNPENVSRLLPTKVTYLNGGEPYDDYSFSRTCTLDKGRPSVCTTTYPDGTPRSTETYIYDCK